MSIVHVAPIADQRWVVTLDGDAAPVVSEHATREEAETAARAHAITFGIPLVEVHHINGDVTREILDPDPRPPYPGAAKGALGAH
jgi:hypothetical protein